MNLFTLYYDTNLILKRAIDIAQPRETKHRTALFYVHGGGWNAGSRDGFHQHLEHFSRNGYVCASAGYRLVPHVRIDQQLEDIVTGYHRFMQYIKEQALDIKHVIVLGSSAGAHLASLLALTKFDDPNLPKPAACVSINGPATLEYITDAIRASVEGAVGATYSEAPLLFRKFSPDQYVNEQATDFLFILAGFEKFFPHQYVYNMSAKLQQFGHYSEVHRFSKAEHGFFYGLRSELQLEALPILEQFIKRYN